MGWPRVIVYPGEAHHLCFPHRVPAEGLRNLLLEFSPVAVRLALAELSIDLWFSRFPGSLP
jgi:hypothetical protein